MTRRIRVARVVTRMNIGGPSIHVTQLTRHLDPSRYESILLTGVPSISEGDMTAYAESEGVHPRLLSTLGREVAPSKDVAALRELVEVFRRFRPHIVHTHMAKAGTLGRIAAYLARVPIRVHTYHGHVFRGYFGGWKSRAVIEAERGLGRITDAVVAVGELQRQDLIELGIASASRIHPIPLGLPIERFLSIKSPSGLLRRELRLPEDVPLIGIVARLVPIKSHVTLIDAFARLDVHPQPHLVIVGDGVLRAELESRVAVHGLGERVSFLGWRADLENLYPDLDLFVLPSLNEGSPVAVIEALASGVPVVASQVGGVPEIVRPGESGWLVPAGSVSDLQRAMLQALQDRESATRYAAQGRGFVAARYGVGRLCADIDRLYSSLVVSRGLAAA